MPREFRLLLKCIGQIRVFDSSATSFNDEDRGVEYYPAFIIEEVEQV
jgi:hypothetical protein